MFHKVELNEVKVRRFSPCDAHENPKLNADGERKMGQEFKPDLNQLGIHSSIRRRCNNAIFEFFIHCIDFSLCILRDNHRRQLCTICFCSKAQRNSRFFKTSDLTVTVVVPVSTVLSVTISDHIGVSSIAITLDSWW